MDETTGSFSSFHAPLDGSISAVRGRPLVLVVDDDARNRMILREWLSDRYDVIEASGGKAALFTAASTNVDIVLLDVMMPEINGVEVCARLRVVPRTSYLPIVMVSALAEQEHRNAALEAGADEFLTKPVDRRELLLRVRTLLRIRDQDATIRRQLEEVRRLSAMKDDLISFVVHDLRNPMDAMLGQLGLIKERATGELVTEVDACLRAGDRALQLLNDLLEVRRFEEGAPGLSVTPQPVPALLASTLDVLRGTAERREVSLVLVPTDVGPIAFDAGLVRRAVENLLANAIRFAPPGTAVEVRAVSGRDTVSIEVADRGPGLCPEVRARLFTKFGSSAERGADRRHGFGLGLYFVQLVAHAHRGEVRALDRVGGGTVFRLSLPVDAAAV